MRLVSLQLPNSLLGGPVNNLESDWQVIFFWNNFLDNKVNRSVIYHLIGCNFPGNQAEVHLRLYDFREICTWKLFKIHLFLTLERLKNSDIVLFTQNPDEDQPRSLCEWWFDLDSVVGEFSVVGVGRQVNVVEWREFVGAHYLLEQLVHCVLW